MAVLRVADVELVVAMVRGERCGVVGDGVVCVVFFVVVGFVV